MPLRPLGLALAACLVAPHAAAISNDEVNAGLQFNFSNPGARSLGLGGAFTGLADDATAAFANPAGITILARQEMAVEARHFRYDTRFVTAGSIDVTFPSPGSTGRVTGVDPVFGRAKSTDNALSYLSYVWPGDGYTLAFYYTTVADFSTRYRTSGTAVANYRVLSPVINASASVLAAEALMDLEIDAFGATAAFPIGDAWSVGISIQNQRIDLASSTRRFGSNNAATNNQLQRFDDANFTGTLGVLWRSADARWSAGAAYRRGARFNGSALNNFANVSLPFELRLEMPDVLSVGAAWRPTETLTLTADVNRIWYSNLSDNIRDIFTPNPAVIAPRVSDGIEYRIGAEYQFATMQENPVFVRVGYWRDPEHQLAATNNPRPSLSQNLNLSEDGAVIDTLLFRPGRDQNHATLGLGFASSRFQVDAAVDLSRLVDTVSISTVWRF